MAIALTQCPRALNQVDVLFGCIIKSFKGSLHGILFRFIMDVKCSPRQGVKHPWRQFSDEMPGFSDIDGLWRD